MNKIIDFKEALTFDDILLVPQESHVLPKEVDVSANLTKNIKLQIPIISAAMDTVTEWKMAIALAQAGGMGILHKNMSIERQAVEVKLVKRAESGVILDPITLTIDKTLRNALAVMRQHGISGLPVVNDKNKLLGILTGRDIRFEEDLDRSVSECMTKDNLVTAPINTTLHQARSILQKNRIEKLLLVNKDSELAGMITVKDILKKEEHPSATLDEHGRLRVGAAIGVTKDVLERIGALVDVHVDLLVLDSAHGHSKGVLQTVEKIKKTYSSLPLIAGNVATPEGTQALIDAGADTVKVGIGAGASCTTRVVAGIGVPQLTAVLDCCEVAEKQGILVISDGGVRFSGDVAKSIAAGASSVMIGSLLAGMDESPGETLLYEGRQYKTFRGMGSLGPMSEGSADRYFQDCEDNIKLVPEGIEGMVPFRGKVNDFIFQIVGGLRASMGYCGVKTISEMQTNTKFVRVTSAGGIESHPHNVRIVKEAPNYQVMKVLGD
tara:strand:+ start:9765 stop:11246 length:1482 start_codon:yes stop_codon:yes gene_type:complete